MHLWPRCLTRLHPAHACSKRQKITRNKLRLGHRYRRPARSDRLTASSKSLPLKNAIVFPHAPLWHPLEPKISSPAIRVCGGALLKSTSLLPITRPGARWTIGFHRGLSTPQTKKTRVIKNTPTRLAKPKTKCSLASSDHLWVLPTQRPVRKPNMQ